MTQTIEMLRARINILQQRDPIGNANLINKLMRQIRKLENK